MAPGMTATLMTTKKIVTGIDVKGPSRALMTANCKIEVNLAPITEGLSVRLVTLTCVYH